MLTVEIKGLRELQVKMDNLKNTGLKKEVGAVLEAGVKTFVRNAKRDAPVDVGILKNGISYFPRVPLSYEVVSNANYSAYLEWGTITKVVIPEEQAVYAALFKGKGLRENGGIIPRPFFFKQTAGVRKQIETGIKGVVDNL